jgi:hypothetical protein
MRAISRLSRNKSAISNIVAYVLLISITISLSVLVYGWLRFYVSPDDIKTCSDDVNIVIRSYECFKSSGTDSVGRIKVTLKNKGLFTVDGYELRVHDRPDADFGFYLFDNSGARLAPGEEYTTIYLFNELVQSGGHVLEDITYLEVQPFVLEGDEIRCKSRASQEVVCQ